MFKTKRYPVLFWDNPSLQQKAYAMSMEKFRRYVHSLKKTRPFMFNLIIRKFIERGSLTESFQIFTPDEIRKGLEKLKLWKKAIPEIRQYAWHHTLALKVKRYFKVYV